MQPSPCTPCMLCNAMLGNARGAVGCMQLAKLLSDRNTHVCAARQRHPLPIDTRAAVHTRCCPAGVLTRCVLRACCGAPWARW